MDTTENVLLNVSGKLYQIHKNIKCKLPTSQKSQLISYNGTDQVEYVYYKNRELFERVINFFGGSSLHIPNTMCPVEFEEELEFWKIKPKELSPCCYIKYKQRENARGMINKFLTHRRKKFDKDQIRIQLNKPYVHQLRIAVWNIIEFNTKCTLSKVYLIVSAFFILSAVFGIALSTLPVFREKYGNLIGNKNKPLHQSADLTTQTHNSPLQISDEITTQTHKEPLPLFLLSDYKEQLPILDDSTTQTRKGGLPILDDSTTQTRKGGLPVSEDSTTQTHKEILLIPDDSTTQTHKERLLVSDDSTTQTHKERRPISDDSTTQTYKERLLVSDDSTTQPYIIDDFVLNNTLEIIRDIVDNSFLPGKISSKFQSFNSNTEENVISALYYMTNSFFLLDVLCRIVCSPNLKAIITDILIMFDIFVTICAIVWYTLQVYDYHLDYLLYVQIFRVLGLFRILQHIHAFKVLGYTLNFSKRDLLALMMYVCVVIIIMSNFLYFVENTNEFTSIPETWWYTVVTMTTLGYGDMVPTTVIGKIIGALSVIIGFLLFSLIIPIMASRFMTLYDMTDIDDYNLDENEAKEECLTVRSV